MKRVLVTGGAGFIGSHLCERLLESGYEVWCLDCFDAYYPPALKRLNVKRASANPAYRLLEGDLCDTYWLESQIGGQEFAAVYHLAARPGVTGSVIDPLGWSRMNVDATLSLLEVLRKGPATRMIFASSSSVYGDDEPAPFKEAAPAVHPVSPYSALKRSVELLLYTYHHLHGLPVCCLRYFTVYGPRQRPEMAISWFTRAIARGETIQVYGDGSSQRDYSYIEDIIDGSVAALELDFDYEIINLGGSTPTRLRDLIQMIERTVGRQAVIDERPARAAEMKITCADMTRASERLGYSPAVGIEEGVSRYFDWYQENGQFLEEALQALSSR